MPTPILLAVLPWSLPCPCGPQEARAPFDAATVQLDQEQAPFRRLLDFDLDGDLDAIGGHVSDQRNSYRLWAYENDGQGAFQQVWYSGVLAPGGYYGNFGQGEFLIETGKIDADAFPDVVVFIGLYRYVWSGTGNGTFQAATPFEMLRRATGLALADLDEDGRADLVWSDTETLNVLTTTGAEHSLLHGSSVSATVHLGLELLPRDGPGSLDVFVLTRPTQVQLFYGSPAGLQAGPAFTHGVTMPMCDTGDVDGDGDLDAVLFGMSAYQVLRRTAADAWTLEGLASGGPAQFLADIDGDGDLDGACCGGGGNPVTYAPNVQPTDFEIALNDGTGAFAAAFAIPGLGSPELAGVADVDADGDVDLVAGRCVYFARGPIRPVGRPGSLPSELVRSPRSLSDYDGDGDVDVGLALDSVHANDGTGAFAELQPVVAPPPAGTRYVGPGFTGDFDGDGDVDLLVELRGDRRQRGRLGHGNGAEMRLLANDGYGAFPAAAPASDPGVSFAQDGLAAEASLAVDLDQDGDLDLLTRTLGTLSATNCWRNDGSGYLRRDSRLQGSRAEWAGDLDLDGVVDLVDTRLGSFGHELGLLRGIPGGPEELPGFARDAAFPANWTCNPIEGGVAVADYYLQDGFPDLAVARTYSSSQAPGRMLTFVNRFEINGTIGAVTFSRTPDDGVERVRLGDVDGDQLADAVAGPLQGEGELTDLCHVYLNTGATASFSAPTLQLIPNGELVDLDQDGDLDVLAERVVLNPTMP